MKRLFNLSALANLVSLEVLNLNSVSRKIVFTNRITALDLLFIDLSRLSSDELKQIYALGDEDVQRLTFAVFGKQTSGAL